MLTLEKALLVYATYELIFEQNSNHEKMIIDQIINFAKVYLEEEKFRFINKNLDLTLRSKEVNNL